MRVPVIVGVAACSFTPGTFIRDAPVSDQATDDANDPDTPKQDAAFDPATDCPVTYDVVLGSTSATSRYRIVTTLDVFWPHEATCRNDKLGATHAVAFQTQTEIVELDAHLDTNQSLDRYYVGGVQAPNATSPAGSWVSFDGTDLVQTAWHTPESEPDDGGDGLEDQGQQLLILDRLLTYLHDATGVSTYGIVCECDGQGVHPKAADYVAMDPNNPN